MNPELPSYRYWAFISYSHQDNRSVRATGRTGCVMWAQWLHRTLETYLVPEEFQQRKMPLGEPMPARFFPCFRDEEELPINSSLSTAIRTALEQSRFLIVICSPRSAASRYVNEEVRYFRELGRKDRILTIIVDGEPNAGSGGKPGVPADMECFCPALRHPLSAQGQVDDTRLESQEPIAGDLRDKNGAAPRELSARELRGNQPLLESTKLKILAGMMGVGFDELVHRDRQRQLADARARARRSRRLAFVFAILAVAAAVGGAIALHEANRAKLQEARAEARLADSLVAQGNSLRTVGRYGEAQELFAEAVGISDRLALSPLPAAAGSYLASSLGRDPVIVLLHSNSPIRRAAFNPKGDRLAVLDGESTMTVLDPISGQVKHQWRASEKAIMAMGWREQGTQIWSTDLAGVLRLWDPESGESAAPSVTVVPEDNVLADAALSPDGQRLYLVAALPSEGAGSSSDATNKPDVARLLRFDFSTQETGVRVQSPIALNCVAVSPDESEILLGGTDGGWLISGTGDHKPIELSDVKSHPLMWAYGVLAVAFSSDSQTVAWGTSDDFMEEWSAGTHEELVSRRGHYSGVRCAVAAPDEDLFLLGGGDGSVHAFRPGGAVEDWHAHNGAVEALSVSPDGKWFVSGGSDGELKLWELHPASPPPTGGRRFKDTSLMSPTVKLSHDGQRLLLTGIGDENGYVVDRNSGRVLGTFNDTNEVKAATFDQEPGKVLVLNGRGELFRWTLPDQKELILNLPPSDLASLEAAPDGSWIAAGTDKGQLLLGDIRGKPLRTVPWRKNAEVFKESTYMVLASAPLEHKLAVAAANFVSVIDPRTGKILFTETTTGNAEIDAIAISPDGKWLACEGDNSRVLLWNLAGHAPPWELQGHGGPVKGLAFTPDNRVLVSGAMDGRILLWRVEDRRVLGEFGEMPVVSLALAPDGYVATGVMGDQSIYGDVDWVGWNFADQVSQRLRSPDSTIQDGAGRATRFASHGCWEEANSLFANAPPESFQQRSLYCESLVASDRAKDAADLTARWASDNQLDSGERLHWQISARVLRRAVDSSREK